MPDSFSIEFVILFSISFIKINGFDKNPITKINEINPKKNVMFINNFLFIFCTNFIFLSLELY